MKLKSLQSHSQAAMQPADLLHKHLRAVVLLSGALRTTPLSSAIARSHLDLPLDTEQTLLGGWRDAVSGVAEACGLESLALRVLLNQNARRPVSADSDQRVLLTLEDDLRPLRGTAGVLRDIVDDYADDDLLLVGSGAQVMLQPLPTITLALAARQADVCLVANDDGMPCGMLLLRCGVLRSIATRGFVDLKEQALPAIARRHNVAVLPCPTPAGLPARTLPDYIRALRWRHHWWRSGPAQLDPFSESWRCSFSIVEAGATVHASARVHDSVVLAGARVEAGAVLVQSVAGPGATVHSRQTLADRAVGADNGAST